MGLYKEGEGEGGRRRVKFVKVNMKVLVLCVATLLVALPCHGAGYQRFPLRMKSERDDETKCASWRLAVEAHNIFGFKTVPEECVEPNKEYLVGGQYQSDSKTVNQQAFFFARDRHVGPMDTVIFSIDGTALSNLPYYENHGYGSEGYDKEAYDEWVLQGDAPALPETLKNYNKLLSLGYKIIFLSGRLLNKKAVTEANLKNAGFHTWEKLILKDPFYISPNALSYKQAERGRLVQQGYNIVMTIGDQYSDIKGENNGERNFKLPNPIYYIA